MKKLLFGTILLTGLIVFPIMSMAQVRVSFPLPPPIPFIGPPNVVVLPGTDVYAVPDVNEELFFRQGWWWRHHDGHWYRSKFYDQGWAYYRGYPSWHKRIPHDWRDRYRDHRWGGRPWNHSYIHHGDLNNHWRRGPGGGPGGPGGRNLHGGRTGGPTHPDGRMNRSDVGKGGRTHPVNKSDGGGSHRGDRR